MPYRDPFAAAPTLWALRHQSGSDFEASVCPLKGSIAWRKGWECAAIALYRQNTKMSPTVNFGRIPSGYRISSRLNRTLLLRGQVFRGGLVVEDVETRREAGVAPLGPLSGDPQGLTWCGHDWSTWIPLVDVAQHLPRAVSGLYRIRSAGGDGLVYIGQGRVRERLLAHRDKYQNSEGEQGQVFAAARHLECSWVLDQTWLDYQRLELENDLIGAHVLVLNEVPPAQFIG